jgi:hypothetical protein
LPVKPYEQNIVEIKETENSIPGEKRTIYGRNVPKGYYPEVSTFEY